MRLGRILTGVPALFLILLLLLLVVFHPSGEELFRKEGCINCHRFKGEGGGVGPDLTGLAQRRSDAWMKEHIRNPRSHNPYSQMPSFGHLSGREIKAIIRYLKKRG